VTVDLCEEEGLRFTGTMVACPLADIRIGMPVELTQERLVALIDAGKASQAEELWRAHMTVVGRILMRRGAARTVIDLMNHH
jgi:hypothetical protein